MNDEERADALERARQSAAAEWTTTHTEVVVDGC